jgi:hypothetical protein
VHFLLLEVLFYELFSNQDVKNVIVSVSVVSGMLPLQDKSQPLTQQM